MSLLHRLAAPLCLAVVCGATAPAVAAGAEVPAAGPRTSRQADQGTGQADRAPRSLRVVRGAGSSFVIAFDPAFDLVPEAERTFEAAARQWADVLVSPVPVTVDVRALPLPGTPVLGGAQAGSWHSVPGRPDDLLYPEALANALTGRQQDDLLPDVQAWFNPAAAWYLGADGHPGPGQSDFRSTVLHELGHGLGFAGLHVTGPMRCGAPDAGCQLGRTPFGDHLAVRLPDGAYRPLHTFPDGSPELARALTSDSLYWDGFWGRLAAGGQPVRMFAPPSFVEGSSASHTWMDLAPGAQALSAWWSADEPELMRPVLRPGRYARTIGPVVRGVLRDIGWTLRDGAS
ncbi:hypothetical protein ABT160_16725 [Streptomyces sp. NPDC001941]|uniref:hypothetical protein n=1 Tax=Streptomyces sp. NPDC001941 TaxID=3154659 RepID=UPI00332D075A